MYDMFLVLKEMQVIRLFFLLVLCVSLFHWAQFARNGSFHDTGKWTNIFAKQFVFPGLFVLMFINNILEPDKSKIS